MKRYFDEPMFKCKATCGEPLGLASAPASSAYLRATDAIDQDICPEDIVIG